MNLDELLKHIASRTGRPTVRRGRSWACHCPAHEDQNPSLSVTEGRGGRLLLKCHAGCAFEAITAALDLKPADLAGNHRQPATPRRASAPAKPARPARRLLAAYDYRDEAGKLLFQVCRFEPKDFRQRRPDPAGKDGWAWNTAGVRRVLYRLPELLAAVQAGRPVFIAEGEKDCDALAAAGCVATCNPGGAGKWQDRFNDWLRGAAVVIVADKDPPGRAHAAAVAAALRPVARSVKLLELPDVNGRLVKDAADYFAAGGTAEALRQLAEAAPEFTAPAGAAAAAEEDLNPNGWFKQRFPGLAERHGEPVAVRVPEKSRPFVQDLNESFFAATLAQPGASAGPVVFLRPEGRFYAYRPDKGIFTPATEEELTSRLSDLLLDCARDCRETCDVSALEFSQRDNAALVGTVKRARAILAAPDHFFAGGAEDFLAVGNGMLRLADRALLPFSPDYRRRNKLAVDYVPGARCPLFLELLLGTSLDQEDIGLLQRWCGLALMGRNLAQRILILSGTAGAGKGTFIRILKGIVDEANIASLRTDKLGDRFEIGRLMGKTLLYGADVPANFLNMASASILKSLTGGDPLTAELKQSMDSPALTGEFNVIVTSNSRLTVHLEGDVEAWRRRLVIIAYEKPKPANVIPDLAERILAEEGPGVLNWMLDGLYALRAANWQLTLTARQQERVDQLLLESDSVNVFFRERALADTAAPGLTVTEAYGAYADFCMDRGWNPVDRYAFGREAPDTVQRMFRLCVCHRIKGQDGKQQRGWQHLRLRGPGDTDAQVDA